MARDEARRLLGQVVQGDDPAAEKQARRKAETVSQLCDAYWEDSIAGRVMTRRRTPKKASTLSFDKGRIENHIRPLLGQMKVASVSTADVESFMWAVAEGKTAGRLKPGRKRSLSNVRGGLGTASRTVGLLGGIFTYAVRHQMRTGNPVRGVIRPADGRRDRRLSDEEYAAFGKALHEAGLQNIWPAALGAVRFLAVTGWRSGEALTLRWPEVDLAKRTIILPESKTGPSMRPLSQAACDLLRNQARTGELVFPPTRGGGIMSGFRKLWNRITKLGALPADVTPSVLRHSFASLASDLGFSELTIGTLLGHKGHSITSRYVHAANSALLAASDAVANETLVRMQEAVLPSQAAYSGETMRSDNVIPFRRRPLEQSPRDGSHPSGPV
jgi:integrase